jgi:hypothetical protein
MHREMRNAYIILDGKPESKRLIGKPTRGWDVNINIDLKEIECDGRK